MVYKARVFLTQEKKEIASNMLKQGKRHGEIASVLGVSLRTVDKFALNERKATQAESAPTI